MDWEMVGALGEIVGALGVIATLIYLARQIRISNAASRRATMQELIDRTHHQMSQLTSEGELARIFARGLTDFDSLGPAEQMRLRAFLYQSTLLYERFYYLEKEGGLDAWIIEETGRLRRDLISAPGFQMWFKQRGGIFSDEFRGVLEKEMAQGQGDLLVPTEAGSSRPQEAGQTSHSSL